MNRAEADAMIADRLAVLEAELMMAPPPPFDRLRWLLCQLLTAIARVVDTPPDPEAQ
ncbi:MAG TPA: hypothetical protein VF288_10665 [Mycobacteriales bacterium]